MNRKLVRSCLTVVVLLGSLALALQYYFSHPALRHQLSQTQPSVIAILFLLYILFVASLALIMHATLKLCHIKMPRRESLLLTIYSSIINFFGPLQSGPAFRAIYLKKRHKANLKVYGLATLAYYAMYATINIIFLFSNILGWWLVVISAIGLLALIASQKMAFWQRFEALNSKAIIYLAFATFLQVFIFSLIFYTELRSLMPMVHYSQALVYTGAANLALFVSITPGAIGFRESFLLFSQNLHHIPNATIVAASLLDRSIYVILLIGLAIYIFASHTHTKLRSAAKI